MRSPKMLTYKLLIPKIPFFLPTERFVSSICPLRTTIRFVSRHTTVGGNIALPNQDERRIQSFPQSIRNMENRHTENTSDHLRSVTKSQIDFTSITTVEDALTIGIRHQLPLANLEELLDHLLNKLDYKNNTDILNDLRFIKFIDHIKLEIKNGTSMTITKILFHLLTIPNCPAKTSLALQCSRFAVARPNSFDPKTFVECVYSIAKLGIADVPFVEFIRSEALHLLPEFGPSELCTLLEGFRVMQLFNRQLIDLVVERMSEEIDRYTPMDIVRTLHVIASMGLVRVHITRQLASLALSNTEQLTSSELTSIASSLARLRFIKENDFMTIVKIADETPSTKGIHELCFTSTLIESLAPNHYIKNLVRRTLPSSISDFNSSNTIPILAAIYCAINFELKEFYPQFGELLPLAIKQIKTLEGPVASMLSEILTAMKIEHSETTFPISTSILSQINEIEKTASTRWEGSRPLAELSIVLSHLTGKYQLKWERNVFVGSSYYVQFLNEENKIVFELETPQDHTGHRLRHRHLTLLGYRPISLNFWKWKTCQTEEGQLLMLKNLLIPHLVCVGLLNEKRDLLKNQRKITATIIGSKLKEIPKRIKTESLKN